MICPIMSRPIVYSTVEDGGDQQWKLYPIECIKERCMAWFPEQPCKGGSYCLTPEVKGNFVCETCCYAGIEIPGHCKLIGIK